MTATAMNDFLQQLHDLVPTFNVASIPRDATGVYASPVHIIAELLNVTPSYIQKIINNICANVNVNCTKMKVIVNGTEQRNTIMVGNAESIMLVLASCTRRDIATIVARLPIVVPVPQAPVVAPVRPPTSVALGSQALVDEMDVNSNQDNILQDDDAMIIKHTFVPEPTQMVDFVLKLADGSDFIVPVRRDGYVNVTKICQAAGKQLGKYFKSDHAKEYMKFLQKALDDEHSENVKLGKAIAPYGGIALLSSYKGGNVNTIEQGTFAHPDLAIIIAAWACNSFQFQVSRWIRELMITGKVELGKEKTPDEVNEKLEKTFQAIDEDEKLYLREKRCLELSLLRIECDKRKRDDASAEEERAVKRQRDDEEYDAKRKRDDAVFDEEMKLKALQLITQKQKDELEYNKLVAPFVKDIEIQTNDAHVKALCKDIGMACLTNIQNQVSGGSSSSPVTKFCNDITTIGCKLGFPKLLVEQNRVNLGRLVAEAYRTRFKNKDPDTIQKHVNGGWYPVFTYDIEHEGWICEIISKYLNEKQATPSVPKTYRTRNSRVNLRTIGNSSTQ